MDVYCLKCGEPWEIDSLHDVAEERYDSKYCDCDYSSEAYKKIFDQVRKDFFERGCVVLGTRCSKVVNPERAAATSALAEYLGDDIDGIAAMLDDIF